MSLTIVSKFSNTIQRMSKLVSGWPKPSLLFLRNVRVHQWWKVHLFKWKTLMNLLRVMQVLKNSLKKLKWSIMKSYNQKSSRKKMDPLRNKNKVNQQKKNCYQELELMKMKSFHLLDSLFLKKRLKNDQKIFNPNRSQRITAHHLQEPILASLCQIKT